MATNFSHGYIDSVSLYRRECGLQILSLELVVEARVVMTILIYYAMPAVDGANNSY